MGIDISKKQEYVSGTILTRNYNPENTAMWNAREKGKRLHIIAGFGFVGKSIKELIPGAHVYDLNMNKPFFNYDFCHICVPTPMMTGGKSDISAVEDVISKVNSRIYVIRSTVPVGFCKTLEDKNIEVVMQPEYVASSSPYPAPLSNPKSHPFIVLGGNSFALKQLRKEYEKLYPPTTQFVEMSSTEAEICKYMENSFIATYVTFCNEFYDICQGYGADYDKVREGFLADPRMTKYWTYVYEEKRGWSGHCLPKDLASIIHETCSPFLTDVVENNKRQRREK